MADWSPCPTIYEINTWAWLQDLSTLYGRQITLGSVPDEAWDAIATPDFDAVWLMGVWERSPEGARIANENAALRAEFENVLPDFRPSDNIGSAYCVRGYSVDAALGGDDGLAAARGALSRRGLRLILDYVPNHVARDHRWVSEHPEYLVQGSREDLSGEPSGFFASDGKIIACGRDPFFPPWRDVAQLNAFDAGLRQATIETLSSIAARCDGMRCDMAMLMTTDVFARTWGTRAGVRPEAEFWPAIIDEVRRRHSNVIFIAEAYWDLEWTLQQQGFDYCYDKRLYDRLLHDDAESVRGHLRAELAYQRKLIRFIENHDEPRAALAFEPPKKARAAAVAVMTLPGAKLLHEGQFEGNRVHLPVFLNRRPSEPEDEVTKTFYRRLLPCVRNEALRGEWTLCTTNGWPDNASNTNFLAWCWSNGASRLLVVINHAPSPSQGHVVLPWRDLAQGRWLLTDPVQDREYVREGAEIQEQGLYVALGPWEWHYLAFTSLPS